MTRTRRFQACLFAVILFLPACSINIFGGPGKYGNGAGVEGRKAVYFAQATVSLCAASETFPTNRNALVVGSSGSYQYIPACSTVGQPVDAVSVQLTEDGSVVTVSSLSDLFVEETKVPVESGTLITSCSKGNYRLSVFQYPTKFLATLFVPAGVEDFAEHPSVFEISRIVEEPEIMYDSIDGSWFAYRVLRPADDGGMNSPVFEPGWNCSGTY